jgi:hypothetical protein
MAKVHSFCEGETVLLLRTRSYPPLSAFREARTVPPAMRTAPAAMGNAELGKWPAPMPGA